MKKIVSILLLVILLFNWVGYRFVSDYFETVAVNNMQEQLDKETYLESDLVSIKVPFSVPYGINSNYFEKVSGTVDIHGVSYQYVKRRFYNDSLELLCIPNMAKTNVTNARDEFFKLANDFVNNSTSKKSSNQNHTVKFSVSDFSNDHLFVYHFIASQILSSKSTSSFSVIPSPFLQTLDKPPQVIA